jgi:hypothetical protein
MNADDADEIDDDGPLMVDCGPHGRRIAAVVCCHMLSEEGPVGFIENSSDPDDLQAWCDACEEEFAREEGLTPAFEAFNDRAIVCDICYQELKERHSLNDAD